MDLLAALVTIWAVMPPMGVNVKLPVPVREEYLMMANWPTDMLAVLLKVMFRVPLADKTPVPLVALMMGADGFHSCSDQCSTWSSRKFQSSHLRLLMTSRAWFYAGSRWRCPRSEPVRRWWCRWGC